MVVSIDSCTPQFSSITFFDLHTLGVWEQVKDVLYFKPNDYFEPIGLFFKHPSNFSSKPANIISDWHVEWQNVGSRSSRMKGLQEGGLLI